MSSSTTGKTTKLNWKLSLLLGLLAGGVLGAGIQHYNNVPVTTAYSSLKSDYQSVVDELNKEKLSVKQLTDEKALLVESSNQKLDALNLQLDKQKDQLKQLTEQLVTIQKQQETTQKLVVTKKKLNKEVVALKTKTKQQKEVIDNSNVLFEQKSKTQHDLAVVQKQIVTLSPEIKKNKKSVC